MVRHGLLAQVFGVLHRVCRLAEPGRTYPLENGCAGGGKTPSPVAGTYPDFDIDSGTIRRLTLHFFDQGSKKSKAKPKGQHGSEIKWAILSAPPASLTDLTNSSFDTHTPFTLEFDESQRGQTVYFCLCWENTTGQKGPWSEIQSAIIP
jgi:hypothetical protein